MAVPYYSLTKVKSDLNITDTGNDTQLGDWNDEAESEIDDFLYTIAAKARLLTKLPVLPYTAGSVPEAVQGAADNLVKAKYYEYVKDLDMAKRHEDVAHSKLEGYFTRLSTDKIIFGRIAR